MDELCSLLPVGATFSSDIVTLRERLQSNLQLEPEGLQENERKAEAMATRRTNAVYRVQENENG